MEPSKTNDPMIGRIFFNKYTLEKKLGEGSFGSIYSARCEQELFAIKFEDKNKGQNLLESEAYVMSYLHGPRIPYVKSYGYSGDFNVLVMELMGKSLEDLFENLPSKKMSVRCVCNIAIQLIENLQFIHDKHIIHRDIKPDNFVIGKGEKSKYIFILDFGLAKKFRSSTTLKHYPMVKKKKLTGTARYASINALAGYGQSRRDDLEAVGYVLMYFLRGRLPWQGLVVKNKDDRYARIMEKKRDTSPEDLCRGFPKQFEEYITYTRNLEYEQDPDYGLLKALFMNVLRELGFGFDYYYDWDVDSNSVGASSTTGITHPFILEGQKKLENLNNAGNTNAANTNAVNTNNFINNKFTGNLAENNLNVNKAKETENIRNNEDIFMSNRKVINSEEKEPVKITQIQSSTQVFPGSGFMNYNSMNQPNNPINTINKEDRHSMKNNTDDNDNKIQRTQDKIPIRNNNDNAHTFKRNSEKENKCCNIY